MCIGARYKPNVNVAFVQNKMIKLLSADYFCLVAKEHSMHFSARLNIH